MKKRIASISRFMFASLAVVGLFDAVEHSSKAQNEPTIANDSVEVTAF